MGPAWCQGAKPPVIDPSSQKAGSPGRAVAGFLLGWQHRSITEMRRFVQKSMLTDLKVTDMGLNSYLDTPLLGGKIWATVPVKGMENVLADVKAQLWTKTRKGVKKHVWKFRLVRETKPSTPSPKGTWGVNAAGASIVD